MADITFDGMDDAIRALDAAGNLTDELVSEMLQAGADVVTHEIRDGISRSRYKISHYASSVKPSKKLKRKRGDSYVTITASGNNSEGRRRAEVLFVLNYGRREQYGRIEPGYFWTLATQRAQDPAAKAMEEVLSDHYKKEGL